MTSPVGIRGDRPGVVPRVSRDDLLAILVLGVLYYAAARLGLRLAIVEDNITPLWPPTGLALVAFLRYGRRLWPGVAIAAFLVNLPITNTIAPIVAARLLERVGFRQEIDRVRDVVALVGLGALLSMTISATIGTAALVLSSRITLEGFWVAWTVWWAGDAMGILVVAPSLLCVLTWNQVEPRLGLRRLPEALVMAALLLGASAFAMGNRGQLLFLLPPLVGWIAWRFQLRGAAPAVLLVSTVATWGASRMVGWFGDLSLTEQMLTLQLFNATIAFTAFFLSALVSERTQARERLQRAAHDLEGRVRQRTSQLVEANEHLGHQITERREAETKLRRSEHELAEAQDLARLGRWEWDLGSGTVTWSDDLYRIHGYEPGAFPMTFEKAVELVPRRTAGGSNATSRTPSRCGGERCPTSSTGSSARTVSSEHSTAAPACSSTRPARPFGCSGSSRTSPNASTTTASTGSPRRCNARCCPRTSRRSMGSPSPRATSRPRWGSRRAVTGTT